LKKKIISVLKFLLFFAIGIFFIWLVVRKLTPAQEKDILNSFRQADYKWIILLVIFGILSNVFRTIRWQILLEPLKYKPKFKNVFLAVLIGYFANLALPRLGEVSRCSVLTKYEKIPFNKSFGTVITERAVDIISFILLFIINFYLQFEKLHSFIYKNVYIPLLKKFPNAESPVIYIILSLIVIIIILFFVFRKKISNKDIYKKIKNILYGFLEGIKSIVKIKKPVLFIFHTLLIWISYLLMAYICFNCFPETSSLGIGVGLSVLVFASVGMMIVQGGIGVYPAIVLETLAVYGVSKTSAYAMGWLLWSSQTIMIIVAGSLALILLPILNKNKNGKI